MRIRKKKWAPIEIANSNQIVGQNFSGDWEKYFAYQNQIHLEIGCGKGKFINEMAEKFTDVNFIALEKYLHIIAMGVRCANNLLPNLAFIIDDVQQIQKYFPSPIINQMYINFCDPWHKRKHAKRRLTHKNFLDVYKKILIPGSKICFKTDNLPLFEFSLNQFFNDGWKLRNIFFDLHNTNFDNVTTEYEEKFSSQGMPIFYCEAFFID